MVAQLAGPVAAALPVVAARVPPTPATELGRLRAYIDGDLWLLHDAAFGSQVVKPHWSGGWPRSGESPVQDALRAVPQMLVERLVGALELTVPELNGAGAPDLTAFLGAPPTGALAFGLAIGTGTSEAISKAGLLERLRPGAVPLVEALARRLAVDPPVAAHLAPGPEIADEPGIAAAHGAAYLALAVVTAAAVLRRDGIAPWLTEPPAVLGVAIGIAVRLLRDTPMPAAYAGAVLARARREFRLPRHSGGSAPVSGHVLALLEGAEVPDVDFRANGLVAVVPGGVVIRIGIESGYVRVQLIVLDGPPPEVAPGWEEIVEVSWRAATGAARPVAAGAPDRRPPWYTPPWPGDYRMRVHARDRDEADDSESYQLVVWRAPTAPETVYARTDRLGHRLRGEPQPVGPQRPEAAYRWIRRSSLGEAATVTVVTGAAVEDVLRAFGADPARPESMIAVGQELIRHRSIDPWVTVLDVGGAVLAVEFNGWQGSNERVLSRASARGRAASMYWNINALTRLSFAERGVVQLSQEPFGDLDAPPSVAATLTGLDFADHYRGKPQMGLVAVQRFTGYGITEDDLARIVAADIAFRIMPDAPTG
jgi:hypothetical protein